MRERFELAVKIVGLVLLCGGVLLTVGAAFRLLMAPDWSSYSSQLEAMLPDPVPATVKPALAQFDDLMARGWRHALGDMAVQGLLPIALGLYLLCSGRWVVRWAYPDTGGAGRGEPKTQPGPSEDREREGDDRRYAPPGLYD